MVEDEREREIRDAISTVRKDLLLIDKHLSGMAEDWRGELSETRVVLAQLRTVFVKDVRLIDKMAASVFYEEKINSIGYRPLTLGNDKDIAKSDSIVNRILKGEHVSAESVKKAVQETE